MNIDLEDIKVVNNIEGGRFEARVGDQLAILDYKHDGNTIRYIHTEVPETIERHGIGSKIARTALEFARVNNLEVIPQCPFVAAYIREHPEYRSLVREDSRYL